MKIKLLFLPLLATLMSTAQETELQLPEIPIYYNIVNDTLDNYYKNDGLLKGKVQWVERMESEFEGEYYSIYCKKSFYDISGNLIKAEIKDRFTNDIDIIKNGDEKVIAKAKENAYKEQVFRTTTQEPKYKYVTTDIPNGKLVNYYVIDFDYDGAILDYREKDEDGYALHKTYEYQNNKLVCYTEIDNEQNKDQNIYNYNKKGILTKITYSRYESLIDEEEGYVYVEVDPSYIHITNAIYNRKNKLVAVHFFAREPSIDETEEYSTLGYYSYDYSYNSDGQLNSIVSKDYTNKLTSANRNKPIEQQEYTNVTPERITHSFMDYNKAKQLQFVGYISSYDGEEAYTDITQFVYNSSGRLNAIKKSNIVSEKLFTSLDQFKNSKMTGVSDIKIEYDVQGNITRFYDGVDGSISFTYGYYSN